MTANVNVLNFNLTDLSFVEVNIQEEEVSVHVSSKID